MNCNTMVERTLPTVGEPIKFDEELCRGCNICVEVCRCDVLAPSAERGKAPSVVYPEECWFCGCCVEHCANEGAIELVHPLAMRVGWRRKETGEYHRMRG